MPETQATRRLLERDRELEILRSLIARARKGRGSIALVEGPAGIGKSTLLQQLGEETDETTGVAFLKGQSSPLEAELGFGVALQLFGPAVYAQESQSRSDLFVGAAAAAKNLFDAGESSQSAAGQTTDSSLTVLNGLHWLLVNLAEREPLVLAVDDIQWADRPTLRFLHFLAQRIEELPVALLMAYRSGESGPSAQLVEAVRHLPGAEIVNPAPLSASAVSDMVEETFPQATEAFRSSLADITAGNPLYINALLRAARDRHLSPTQDAIQALRELTPETLLRNLKSRLAQMPGHEASLVRVAAILGDGAELHQAAAIAEIAIDEAAAAADSLVERGILSSATELRFSHPIIRDTLYAGIGEAERGALHLRAAEVLKRDNAPVDIVANQLLHARVGREQWVVDVLVAAAAVDRLHGAPESASTHLERALREGGGLTRRAEILLELGLTEATVGAERGIELISAAADEMDDPDQRAFALMNLARILGIRGRYGASAEIFTKAEAVLSGTGSELLWWAEAGQAVSGSHDLKTRMEARRKLEHLLEREDLDELPIGRTVLGFAALERVYSARPRQEAVALADRITRREPEDVEMDGVAYRIAAMAYAMCGEVEAARALIGKLDALSRKQGSTMELAALAYPRMLLALDRGDVGELGQQALASLEGARLGWGIGKLNASAAIAVSRWEAGASEEARRTLEGVDAELPDPGELQYPVWLEARGLLRLGEGDSAAALADFERSGQLQRQREFDTLLLSHLPWRSGAALAAARLGDRERAVALAEEELVLSRRSDHPRAFGTSLRTLGLACDGEPEAVEILREAVALHEASGSALELARSLTELGAALRRARLRKDCREPLREAMEVARTCGALTLAERAETELRASGARPRRRALSGREALTPSERRIATLAASGLTNREIAEQLFISRKTVEHHLGSVYRKLSIKSRDALSDALSA